MATESKLDTLTALHVGFRSRYISYEELTQQIHAWASAFPELVRVSSIGRSVESRELWLLTIGPDPERTRPAVWVDGNMHAQELCGSSVALAIAEDVLRFHLAPEQEAHGLPAGVRERLRDVVFYILPRMCPDGAECILTTGRYVRSNPRDRRPPAPEPRWLSQDIDGDGVALLMRKPDTTGEFVASAAAPGLMVPRRIEDDGPFYKVFPEGMIEHFDGSSVPDPYFLGDNDTDLNRNFPWSWMPEPTQEGAGRFPLSEPESRAVVEFTTQHPEIFAWLNLHTFGGVYIRPSGHESDRKMNQEDLELFRQIEEWGQSVGGYPMVSGFEEFLYEPDKPLHGDLADYAYHQRGAIGFVCELWDLFREIGMEKKKPFVDHYSQFSVDDMVRLAKWDAEKNASRAIRPWKTFEHPQIGTVELGGIDPRVGLVNPPFERLAEVCQRQTDFLLRLAALAPRISIAETRTMPLGNGAWRVEATIRNDGYLPSYVLASAKTLKWNHPIAVDATGVGCRLADSSMARRDVGHLEGWGRGRFGLSAAAFYQRSRGSVSSKTMSWVVTGEGTLTLRAGSCRVGWAEQTVNVTR